jgi:hypothetical protein
MSVLRELHPLVPVEVLVYGVMLDLTLNLLGHQALPRLRVPSCGPINHHQTKRFWPANRLKTTNKRSALSDQQPAGTMKNGFDRLY